ncbi:biopolymer transporter ExbD [Dasania marina]|uniref:ExbD/TolR family protein n=1 Tax=Dasania marina TaxID=471499 RepID=UPI0030D6D7D0|tara:strand:- start:10553 stop:10954 length:402 start_codon:yes stop_codon:yes gene_type:complete
MALMKTPVCRLSDDNLIPMINIIFLLLIFFMIAGQIQKSLPEGIALPEGETGMPAELERVELYFSADASLVLDGKTLTLVQLEQQLSMANAANWVLIADKNLTAKQLDEVLRLIQKAGVMRLQLMTQRAGTAP